MPEPPAPGARQLSRLVIHNQVFNNADSYAQAFDEAWQDHEQRNPGLSLNVQEKLVLIQEQLQDHPFQQNQPQRAAEVAAFRVRLLGL
jgi:hypothetical protein